MSPARPRRSNPEAVAQLGERLVRKVKFSYIFLIGYGR